MKKNARKKLLKALCIMLTMIMTIGTITAGASPFSNQIDVKAVSVPDKNIIKNGDIVSGYISYEHPHDVYKFSVEKVSRVIFSRQTGGANLPLWILDDQGYVITSLLLDEIVYSSIEAYLMPGTYMLYVGYEESYSVGDAFSYTLKSEITPSHETFSETNKKNNDVPSRASRMTLGSIITGVLCNNEPGYLKNENNNPTDFYKFEVYGTVSHKMRLECWHQFPVEIYILESDMNRVAFRSNKSTSYSTKSDETFTLEPGTYYLGVEAMNDRYGSYFFALSDIEGQIIDRELYHVTVGSEKGIFTKFDAWPYFPINWESEDSGIAVMKGNNLYGKSAGHTTIHGYTEWDNSDPKYSYQLTFTAFVEFTDVQHQAKNPYYYEPVYWAVDNGITGGVKDKDGLARTFRPQDDCTRGQIVAFLWRMQGCPEPKTITDFKDVKESDYYYKAVSWAQEEGIAGGYDDGTFRPSNKCSRAQIVTFLWRMKGCPEMSSTSSFTDVKNKKAYYYQAVLWASENGITGGYTDGTFRPENICSRGQTVSFLYRYYDKFMPKG